MLSYRTEKKDTTRREPEDVPDWRCENAVRKHMEIGTTKKVPTIQARRLFIAFERKEKGEITYNGATKCPGTQAAT